MSPVRKTLVCVGFLLLVGGVAAWRAATGRGPHVQLWLIGMVILIVAAWMHLPPRLVVSPGIVRATILSALSVLSLTCFSTGLVSHLKWTEVKILGFGYQGQWPARFDQDEWFAQMRFGQLIAGRQYGGSIASRQHRGFRIGAYSSLANPGSLWRWRLLMLTRFSVNLGTHYGGEAGALVRGDGLNVLGDTVTAPFWFPALLFGVYPLIALRRGIRQARRRRRDRGGLCADCGYNLTGLASGRCPECGGPVRFSGAGPVVSPEREG